MEGRGPTQNSLPPSRHLVPLINRIINSSILVQFFPPGTYNAALLKIPSLPPDI